MPRRVVAIVGPTATGKSSIALELAQLLGGEIVNADSRQIYRGMDIGTAKPSLVARQRVPHHVYDIVEPTETYSLALYRRDAHAAFESCWSRAVLPWLVGGTGQYVWGLLEDWQVPDVAPALALRAELQAVADVEGVAALHDRLASVDPVAAARIDARNVRRVIRAIEVHAITGIPISTWQQKGTPDFAATIFGIDVAPDELRLRIDARVVAMFDGGFVEEVEALLARGVPPDAPSMSSIGYSQVVRFLRGDLTRDEAIALTQRATHQFARRQRQWFRRDDPRITWVRGAAEIEAQLASR
ncbi:MAG TPA: tRNA (adenosine(37)-N6)-dimethylallyltransferase MiaA [Tepidiformaceae bacterium]